MTDHLAEASRLLADAKEPNQDPLRIRKPIEAMIAAAQVHALAAIAESLRSGTIERTERVVHVWDAPGPNLAASEPEQAPTATPEPAGPPCRKCGPDEHPGLSDALTAGIERLANDQMTELAAALRDYLDESEDADDRGAYIADVLAPLIEGWIQHAIDTEDLR